MAGMIDKVKSNITFENVLVSAMKTPGVRIDRSAFLQKELGDYYKPAVLAEVLRTNPAKAGIPKKVVNKLAKEVIRSETKRVSALSAAASIPGGLWAVGAATVDMTSYFVFVLRVVQKLAYLYGFQEFNLEYDDPDSESMDYILLFIGVMFGVEGADTTLKQIADKIARSLARDIAGIALSKTVYEPVVHKITNRIGVRMTKQVLADTAASTLPVAGSILSGGMTWMTFEQSCRKLRKTLESYNLCSPYYYRYIEDKYGK